MARLTLEEKRFLVGLFNRKEEELKDTREWIKEELEREKFLEEELEILKGLLKDE